MSDGEQVAGEMPAADAGHGPRDFVFSGDITKPLDLARICGPRRRLEVDIGSGMGRFILARAAAHPDVQFIGIERLKPRVEKIAKRAARRGLENVFMVRLEATYVLRHLLPPNGVDRFYLFFPDPWPKNRHAGHRVFNAEFRSLVWSRLAPGGDLQVATDSEAYFADMLGQMEGDPRFRRVAAVARTDDERTNFELIFMGQGIQPRAAGFEALPASAVGERALARCAAEDAAREAAFWAARTPRAKVVHVVGIGGVGMSAVAQAFLDAGAAVTGSDRLADHGDMTPALRALAAQGVGLFPQDGSGIGDATDSVVVSTAIEPDNPDLVAAQERAIEVLHRSEAVERFAAGRRLVAVAGTSGKSTTTALLGWILASAGEDPSVINGASVVGWDEGGARVGSVRRGAGPWCVIEADESDRSFLRFHPEFAIVTNETPDHFDADETHALFARFKSLVTGTVVDALPEDFALLPSDDPWRTRFHALGGDWEVPMPGAHSAWNAAQAAALARAMGVGDEAVRRALATFPGVERRLQRIGRMPSGALVVDDYAHNPAKLAAAIGSVAGGCGRLAVLWRPHGYGPLRHMLEPLAKTFAETLRAGDRLCLLPVYDAGGTADRTISSAELAFAIQARGGAAPTLVGSIAEAETALRDFAGSQGGDAAILICGARDPDLPRLARRLVAEAE